MVAMEAASGLLPSLGRLQPADVACCGSGINVWKNSLRMNRFSPPHAEHDRIHPPDGQQDWPRAPRSTRSQACQSPLQAHAGRRLVHPCSSSTKKFTAAADKRSATAVSMLSCWKWVCGNGSSRTLRVTGIEASRQRTALVCHEKSSHKACHRAS